MNKQNTEQLKMVIELSYEPKLMHGNEKEAMDWFFNYILKKDKLTLVSEEIGDFIGEVKVLELLTKTTPSHDEIKREADTILCGNAGENVYLTFKGGCREELDLKDSYRCTGCGGRFHKDCILKHFELEKDHDWGRQQEREALKVTGETSDGYHTFNELYEFRKLYNAGFFNHLPKWCDVHKSKKHSDGELCFGGGWFIVTAYLPMDGALGMKQISNHYQLKDWDLFQCEEREKADVWDGHTPQDVLTRLTAFLTQSKEGGE